MTWALTESEKTFLMNSSERLLVIPVEFRFQTLDLGSWFARKILYSRYLATDRMSAVWQLSDAHVPQWLAFKSLLHTHHLHFIPPLCYACLQLPPKYDQIVTMQSALLALLASTTLLPLPSALALPGPLSSILSHHNTSTTPHLNSTHPIFDRIDYLVPSTTTFVSVLLYTNHPLPPMEVEVVLLAIEQQLTSHISIHGDGPLSLADDPYEFGIPGCYCSTSSDRENSLTYGVLRDTMRGLHHVMVGGRRFLVAYFDVSEGDAWGRRLGEGNLDGRRSEPYLNSV